MPSVRLLKCTWRSWSSFTRSTNPFTLRPRRSSFQTTRVSVSSKWEYFVLKKYANDIDYGNYKPIGAALLYYAYSSDQNLNAIMATLIPDQLPNRASRGEERVFELLQHLPDNC